MQKRLANIEALRVLAMLMVVTMHFIREAGLLPDAGAAIATGNAGIAGFQLGGMIALFVEALCIVAVNTYVFISGYLGSEKTFRMGKVLFFFSQIWFYLFSILLVRLLLGKPTVFSEEGIYGIRTYLLPIESDTYFFATSFLLLMLLMPVLNVAVRELERKQLGMILAGLLVFFCFVKSVSPLPLAMDRYGYDVIWFVVVYLIGAYFKKYDPCKWISKKPLMVYSISVLMIFVIAGIATFLGKKYSAFEYISTIPYHYNFIFCLMGAIGLFFVFMKLQIKEGKWAELLRVLGKYCFGIYLFHEHPDIRHTWYPLIQKLLHTAGKQGVLITFSEYVVSLLVLFTAGYLMEGIRMVCFRLFAKRQ